MYNVHIQLHNMFGIKIRFKRLDQYELLLLSIIEEIKDSQMTIKIITDGKSALFSHNPSRKQQLL